MGVVDVVVEKTVGVVGGSVVVILVVVEVVLPGVGLGLEEMMVVDVVGGVGVGMHGTQHSTLIW